MYDITCTLSVEDHRDTGNLGTPSSPNWIGGTASSQVEGQTYHQVQGELYEDSE